MAYLTKATEKEWNRIIEIELAIPMRKFFLTYIYDNDKVYDIFHKGDRKELIKYSALFIEDLGEEIQIRLKKVEEKRDPYTRIFYKGGKPKYHLYKDCKFLNKAYFDFKVPGEFQYLIEPENLETFLKNREMSLEQYERKLRDYELYGTAKLRNELNEYEEEIKKYKRTPKDEEYKEKAVEELREWCKQNNFTEENFIGEKEGKIREEQFTLSDMIYKYNSEFVKKYLGLKKIQSIGKMNLDNTGVEEINNLTNIEVDKEIEKILLERKELIKRPFLNHLSKYDWMIKENDNRICETLKENFYFDSLEGSIIEKIKNFWKKHIDIKEKLKGILIKHIEMQNQLGGNGISEDFLREYGFECCNYCNDRSIDDKLEIYYKNLNTNENNS